MTREEKLERALLVLTTNQLISRFLELNDPKALEQAERALNTCNICGQGEKREYQSEHKSWCAYWTSDEPLHDTL